MIIFNIIGHVYFICDLSAHVFSYLLHLNLRIFTKWGNHYVY